MEVRGLTDKCSGAEREGNLQSALSQKRFPSPWCRRFTEELYSPRRPSQADPVLSCLCHELTSESSKLHHAFQPKKFK